MRALAGAVLLAAIVAACQPGGTVFKATVRQPDGSYPLEVVLGDQTGQVKTVEAAPDVGIDVDVRLALPQVLEDPADPNAILLSWATGACDDVAISFQRSDPGYRIDIDAHDRIGLGCTAQLLFRNLRIGFAEPIPIDQIRASGGR